MLTEIGGIPSHPMFVHGAVVLVPIAALLLLAAAWWPAARARLSIATPGVALIAASACFLAKESGEQLEHRRSAMVSLHLIGEQLKQHEAQGTATFLWSLALVVLAILVWAGSSSRATGRVPAAAVLSGRVGSIVLAVLATVAVVAGLWGVIAAGHSGASMVWAGG